MTSIVEPADQQTYVRGSRVRSAMFATGPVLPLVCLVVAIVGLVAVNIWWLEANWRGLPPNIDAAGYLQRTVQFGQDLTRHGIPGVAHYWKTPDTTGPLLIAISGTIRAATGIGTFGLLFTEQIFFAATVIGAYLLARQICGRWLALGCALLVACMPGLIDAGRLYVLAEPATAFFILLVVVQMRVRRYESLGRSLLWGLLVGLTALTRTMMIAVLVGPLIVAGLHFITSRPSRRQVFNFVAGGVLAIVVAGSWYWFSWSTVYAYLTQYGYGAAARNYGVGRSILSWGWWLTRLNNLVNQDLYFPLLCVLVFALLGLVLWSRTVNRFASKMRGKSTVAVSSRIDEWQSSRVQTRSATLASRVDVIAERTCGYLDRPAVQISAILVVSYLVLSSSQNSGSYFELPLAPVLVCAVVAPVGRLRFSFRALVIGSLLIAALLAGFDQFGQFNMLARNQTVNVGPAHLVAFNPPNFRIVGPKGGVTGSIGGVYWTNCGHATITCFYGIRTDISDAYLKAWPSLNDSVEQFVYDYSARFHREPVVFFAFQGPFLNTNSVQLAAQLQGRFLPVGVLLPSRLRHGVGLGPQLEDPQFGQPNFVIAGIPPGANLPVWPGSSLKDLTRVQHALTADGFQRVKMIRLPSAETLGIWWKNR